MHIPSPSTVKALQDKRDQEIAQQILELEAKLALESPEDSASTTPKRPKTSAKSTKSSTRSSVPVGHEYLEEVYNFATIKVCECGFRPEDANDYTRHVNQVKSKSVRKPFIPEERLTQQPLKNNAALSALRNELAPSRPRRNNKENKR